MAQLLKQKPGMKSGFTIQHINWKARWAFWVLILLQMTNLPAQTPVTELSRDEVKFCEQTGLSPEMGLKLRNKSLAPLTLTEFTAAQGAMQGITGLTGRQKSRPAREIVKSLRGEFLKAGYLLFISDEDFEADLLPTAISAVRGTNSIDLLLLAGTHDDDYYLTNENIRTMVSAWATRYDIYVMGAGDDWLEIGFNKLPADLRPFVSEVEEFCPPAFTVAGNAAQMIEQIKGTESVFLFWD